MLRYDLHSHSTASDGTASPGEVVRYAASQGVDVLALTDHDVTTGLAEAEQAAREVGVTLVPGVEISVTWGHQLLHIVGLGIDPENTKLQQGLTGLRDFRVWRAEEIGRRLEKRGIADVYAGARALAKGPSIGRTHFARFLVAQGMAKDIQHAFDKYLKRGKPGYVPGQWASLEETVEWARKLAGGPVRSMGVAKKTVYEAYLMNSDQTLDMESRRQARLMTQPDFANAVLSFLQKKKPTYS